MGKKLARTVHVPNPETRAVEVFTAGEEPPAWAVELITNPAAWGDDSRDVADVPTEVPRVEDVAETPQEPTEADTPARNGSKADWVAYAVAQGMDQAEAEDLTRDDLADHFLGE